MSLFRLHLFGTCHIVGPRGPLTGRATRPRQMAFLAVIAASPGGATRDRIGHYLWPDATQSDARHLVADGLHVLRRCLAEDVIVSAGESIRLEPSGIACDLHEFRAARNRRDWETMLELYEGPFLDGFHGAGGPAFTEWVERERVRCREVAVDAVGRLVAACEARADLSQAIAWLRRGRAVEPFDEALTRRLMHLLAVQGNRAQAVRTYRLLKHRLSLELDLPPSPETTAVYEQVLSGVPTPAGHR